MATVLIAGASGATGRRLASRLLEAGHAVRMIVRSAAGLPPELRGHPGATVTEADLLALSDEALGAAVADCDAVASCLGHRPTFRGMFGPPRDLCTAAVRRLSAAIAAGRPPRPVRFVLMSSVGVADPAADPPRSALDRAALFLLRRLVPPHRDNETAAEHLRRSIATDDPHVEWCCVRPDALTEAEAAPWALSASPVGGLFAGRPTARATVAAFMAALIEDDALWRTWRSRMPVIADDARRAAGGAP